MNSTNSKYNFDNFSIKKKKNRRIEELEKREEYTTYQEDLAFAKELNLLRNDFYYQMVESEQVFLIDFMYKPLDILSGDAYSARKIDNDRAFYLIVDGMGKGLSASLGAMLITSYVNHIIDTCIFDLYELVDKTIKYIKPILLEEETVSVDFILINHKTEQLHYSKFSMPRSLMQTNSGEIIKIKSNNPPISKYIDNFILSELDISNITKFLFHSDGMVENSTRFGNQLYAEYVENDFLTSFTKDDLRAKFLWKIDEQEDDITFIFLNKLDLNSATIATKKFSSTLEDIESASGWYGDIWATLTEDAELQGMAAIVFSELFMNAFEHGNLSIDSANKHKLLEDGIYFDTLEELSKGCPRKISVNISRVEHQKNSYILTSVRDEGDGFDTEILSKIFRNSKTFNGRGVFVSRRSSLGIYYNSKGDKVLYLHKL
ncbi:SpoIIE family protein phosphatase [Sulfurimonas sp.]|uniref:ATP-binding SpoIIE family protein phosphatase n=1 Tax=Sulfurimonas sp. TaxID=2022749 RepID=UPI002619B083|nr:SpoIIE family protein phosphatase [Sulfurimonas sp.]MDD5157977.1 SpoIIE family protein phosphatase [Sulfurimonas sp.]